MCLMSLHIVQGTISPRGTTEGIAGRARNDSSFIVQGIAGRSSTMLTNQARNDSRGIPLSA